MKKGIGLAIVLFAVLLLQTQTAIADIASSAHNFSSISGGNGAGGFVSTNMDEICIFCHTPHNGVSSVDVNSGTDRIPLWNRSTYVGETFTMYNNAGSIHFTPAGKPSGHSLLCLSCHDGVSSMAAVLNNSIATPITFAGGADTIGGGGSLEIQSRINITRNLSDDHPISFVYNNTLNPTGLNDPGDANGSLLGSLRLFNQKVECGSCHDPHKTDFGNFLRMSNANSAMCTTCHKK